MTHPYPIAATLRVLLLGGCAIALPLMVVIPAEAGIHCFSVNMDPRFRGDDASVSNRRDTTRLALGRMRNSTSPHGRHSRGGGNPLFLSQHGSPLPRG